ncbi:MAG: nitroreductase family protein [Veillonellales bacterium]
MPQKLNGLSETEIQILYLATLAPSGHNTQPWTITIKEPKRWVIGSDRRRWLSAVDPENREMILSLGTFIENLSVAARIQGYEAEVKITGKDNFSSEIAEIRLTKGNETNLSDKSIRGRRTVRKDLSKAPIKDEDIKDLAGIHRNSVLYYPLNSKEGSYLSQATLQANMTQAKREDAQQELAEWIRWNEREAKEYYNGLTPESMEMKGIVCWYAKHFLDKKDVLSQKFRSETIKLAADQVQNCAGWLVVRSNGSTVAELINAGRVFQSAWLHAYEKSIGFHPMTQVLEEAPWRSEVARELNYAGSIQFIVRVGYVKEYPQPVSLRMPLSNIVITKSM